jgi:trehalose-phosphatase
MNDELLAPRLDELARTPILLVGAEFDGTLAPVDPDPAAVVADPKGMAALRTLAELPETHAAILSGRALSDLAKRAQGSPRVQLVGSHGGEIAPAGTHALTDEQSRALERARAAVVRAAELLPGAIVEVKPAGVAFHFRRAEAAAAEAVVAHLRAELTALPSVSLRAGRKFLEASVQEADLGRALDRLRRHVGATGVLFLGDELSDEEAFRVLGAGDLGVNVGDGDNAARHRVADPAAVALLLDRLVERRRAHLAAAIAVPIERHAMLSDQRTALLVTPAGRITWGCLPRIDSAALFADLLGGPSRGFFDVAAADGAPPTGQRYVDSTLIVETSWPTFKVTDYLDASAGRAFQRAGRTDLLRVVEGSGVARIVFAPRVDFGRSPTRLRAAEGGLIVEGLRESCVLHAPGVPFRMNDAGPHDTAVADVELGSAPLVLELRYGTNSLAAAPDAEATRRARTATIWSAWTKSLQLPRTAPELCLRSALTLKALTSGPSGAIAAAATTSLPEQVGGVRNWDYRLCWPRDAAIAATALAGLGATGPGLKLLDWMLAILDRVEPGSVVAPVYTVSGGYVGTEGELSDFSGYRDSKPVRVGNAAAQQLQLDVYGPIVELLAVLSRRGAPLSYEHWRMVEAIVDAVAAHWQEPDHGIWELRGPLRHHVHTKTMCWLALDRACTVAGYVGRTCSEWNALRDALAAEIVARGPRSSDQSFGAIYGGADTDAAALWVGLSGLLAPDDPRFVATVARVERELLQPPTVYRYHYDDGLPGLEGGFNLCTTWLIRAYAKLGRKADAQRLFDQYAAIAGPLGLFAEEHDPVHGVALGNYPQAYSHAGLIEAALAIDGA